jgi:glycosyltransferase involved in cell wall biosynthesis
LHDCRPDEIPYADTALEAKNLRWVSLGPRGSVPQRLFLARKIVRPIREHAAELDALLIRGPSPLLPQVARAVAPVPVGLLLVGDYVAGSHGLKQPAWRKQGILLWARLNQWQQLGVARRALTFVNSKKLFAELAPHVPELVETKTTTLRTEDLLRRPDTFQTPPHRMLYAGRIDRDKGLLHMVEALRLLRDRGHDVVLDVVGWCERGDSTEDDLRALARRLDVSERLVLHGFKKVGPELWECYRRADVYLIATISSEGQPRTIWEAMSQSVPVVATRVGSMPLFLEHEQTALLIEPRSADAIASAVERLIEDGVLRRRLIERGFRMAEENTLERRAKELVVELEGWLVRRSRSGAARSGLGRT